MTAVTLRNCAMRYIALRQALGVQVRPIERLVLEFVTYAESLGHTEAPTSQMALDWACNSTCSQGRHAHVCSLYEDFWRMSALGYRKPRFRRRVYCARHADPPRTSSLIRRSLHCCGRHVHWSRVTRCGHTRIRRSSGCLSVVAYASARRFTCELTMCDSISNPPLLHIGDSKFHNSRLVVLHPTVVNGFASICLPASTAGL